MGVETVGLRYFNVFGPRQDPNREYAAVIPRFILWGRAGKPLAGPRRRHPVARLHLHRQRGLGQPARRARGGGRASGQGYNVGCGSRTSLLEIIGKLETMLGRPFTRQHSPTRTGDVPHTLADVSAAKRDLGYEPLVEFDEGLRRTVEFFTGGNSDEACGRYHGVAALCAARRRPAPVAAQAPQHLVVQVSTEPPGLDLTSNPSSAIAGVVFDNVQEGLIKIDRTGKMVPWLAERWYTTDNKNYTFFLRKGVRFHNGREMKAADVKFALDRAVNPETKHPYRTQYDAIQDVIVKDDYTVTVALKKVDATFLYTTGAPGLGDLSARGGGHAQEPADGHRALHGGRVGARRSHRAREEQGLLGEGTAQAGPGGRSASSPIPTRPWPR